MTDLTDLSFRLYDDSGLTSLSTSVIQDSFESDLSDSPQDYVKYFGSTSTTVQLQAASDPGVDNIVLTPTYVLPTWAASTAYSLGDSIIPTSPNGYRYEVTTAGTSNSSEPTWGTILNGTTSDGSVVWTLVAEDSPTTEITLALTSGALDTNTPGAPLSLGNTIDGGVANAVAIYIRWDNTITTPSESFGTPELGLVINSVTETPA